MKRAVILAFVFLSSANAVLAVAADFQILAVEEPPTSCRDAAGRPEGLAVDIVHAIQKRLGNRDAVQILPEVRALDIASRSSNVVLLGFSRIPEREDFYYWILPYLRKPWVLYAREGTASTLHTLADAKSLESIGVVRKDVREFYLEQLGFSNLARVANHTQNIKKALAGRISMFAYDPVGLGYACRQLDIAAHTFQPVLVLKTSDVYIMMSRQGTRPATADQWRDAAQGLKEDGTLDRIARKWAERVAAEIGITGAVHDGVLWFSP